MECHRFLLSWNFKSSPGAAEKATGRATLGGPSGPTWGCQRNFRRRWSTRRAEFRFGSANLKKKRKLIPGVVINPRGVEFRVDFLILNCKTFSLELRLNNLSLLEFENFCKQQKSLTVGSLDASQELRARLAALRGQLSQGEAARILLKMIHSLRFCLSKKLRAFWKFL